MLLALRSLWEAQAAGDVVIVGVGVAADPQIGTGTLVGAKATGRGGGKRVPYPRPPRIAHWDENFIYVPPKIAKHVIIEGAGVEVQSRVGNGSLAISKVIIGAGVITRLNVGTGEIAAELDLFEEEIAALLMAA